MLGFLRIDRNLVVLIATALLCVPSVSPAQSTTDAEAGIETTQSESLDLKIPPSVPETAFSGARSRVVLAAQVMLDRSRHSPGVIDGLMGGNTMRAIQHFRRARGLPAEGSIDPQLMRSLINSQGGEIFQTYTITRDDVEGPFFRVPDAMSAMAALERVGWTSPQELIADRFHMDQDLLRALNPEADFSRVGTRITIVAHREETLTSQVARIEVRKSDNSVVAFDERGNILASYPATVGSAQFPSPSGSMEVVAVAPDANYTFDPSGREWGPDETLIVPPGPNNPVGGIWIDLSKPGYGIHGSPDPQLIGKTASHGCVRLTNWDAKELADAVRQGTRVVFANQAGGAS